MEGSDSVLNVQRLVHQGVEVLACGTCLEFYQLKDQLAVGRITNLYEICTLVLQGRTVSL